jgi:hypothetical protein
MGAPGPDFRTWESTNLNLSTLNQPKTTKRKTGAGNHPHPCRNFTAYQVESKSYCTGFAFPSFRLSSMIDLIF